MDAQNRLKRKKIDIETDCSANTFSSNSPVNIKQNEDDNAPGGSVYSKSENQEETKTELSFKDHSEVGGDHNPEIMHMIGVSGLKANLETGQDWKVFDDIILSYMKEYVVPGISLCVAHNGNAIYSQAYEWANNHTPLSPQHRFRIASVTKILTAIAIMKLHEKRKLKLGDRVLGPKGILTKYTIPPRGDRRLYQVTVKHLLQHSGGWDRDEVGDPCFWPHVADEKRLTGPAMQHDLITYMMGQKLQFSPGSKYAYSNYGYIILGRLIEKLTSTSYEDYVQSLLIEIGVTKVKLGKTKREDAFDDEVEYFPGPSQTLADSVFPGEGKVPAPYGGFSMEAGDSDGGWIASPADLLKILHSLEADAEPRILKPETVQLMLKKPSYQRGGSTWYGFGLDVAWHGKAWEHGGHIDGATSILTRDKDKYAWALLCNYWPADSDYTSLVSHALNHVKGLPVPRSTVVSVENADSSSLDKKHILNLRVPNYKVKRLIDWHNSNGYQLTWVNCYSFHGRPFFNTMFNKTHIMTQSFLDLSYAELEIHVKTIEQESKVLQCLDSYAVDNQVKYSCIIQERSDCQANIYLFQCQAETELQTEYEKQKSNGSHIRFLTCTIVNDNLKITSLFSTHDNPTWWKIGMDIDTYQRQQDRHSSYGRMPCHVKAYEENDETRFCAVWLNPGAFLYIFEHDLSLYRLLNDLTLTYKDSFYPLCVAGYEVDNDHKFAAVCVKEIESTSKK